MVAKIIIGESIKGILHYNEQKVTEGSARLILANGFATEIEELNFQNKAERFEHLNRLRPSVKKNALHISLNFHSSEKMDDAKMQRIATAYMERIGFGEQPFLVYRHSDAAHHHFHIATVSIKRDGTPINLNNIGKMESEKARKSIEEEFGLMPAESKKYRVDQSIKPLDTNKAKYGELPTKRAIGNVVTAVMNSYRFTSLAEYNAVLGQFNVTADRGHEDSEMFKKKGLLYSILDSQGNKIGVPIKASSFYNKPILNKLEKKFEENAEKRKPYRNDLKKRIDQVLNRYERLTKTTLLSELKKNGIALIFRQNTEGFIYGATFVDHRHKCVFNGSSLGKGSLGKDYSAKRLKELLSDTDRIRTYLKAPATLTNYLKPKQKLKLMSRAKNTLSVHPLISTSKEVLLELLNPEHPHFNPYLKQKKRKRKPKPRQL
ncbi:relaxase/mobilization nuclease domain-containing protein [Olivibacter jilunii]|uniref:relaxase/mobilization nuclease domain-containing protein n=1 Tax=Olivibacter jilunii TaxID=985016 RepID=UPI0010302903|nr:relaxase/mobilization nuclease domain-containing protein [Olivibacter jilunii]